MANPLISIRIPKRLLEDAKTHTQKQGYASVQEFIRDAMRRQLNEKTLLEKSAALAALYGSAKDVEPATEEELAALAEKHHPKAASQPS